MGRVQQYSPLFNPVKLSEMDRSKIGKRSRTEGHNWERECVRLLKTWGFEHAVSSRSANKRRDDQKVDICNVDEYKHGRLPLNIQCKNVKDKVDYVKLIDEIVFYDAEHIPVVFHKFTIKSKGTGRFMCKGKYAIMYSSDLSSLLKLRPKRDHYLNLFRIGDFKGKILNYPPLMRTEVKEGIHNLVLVSHEDREYAIFDISLLAKLISK